MTCSLKYWEMTDCHFDCINCSISDDYWIWKKKAEYEFKQQYVYSP